MGRAEVRALSGAMRGYHRDLMHNPTKTDLPYRFTRFGRDMAKGINTRARFAVGCKDSGVLVISAHFSNPTADWICTEADGTRFFDVRPGGLTS